jgi:hypothetical protein
MVLTVSFVLSLVSRACCHHRLQDHRLTSLISASGYQDHTTSPSASGAFVSSRQSVHRIPRPTFVTIAKRPSYRAGMAGNVLVICPTSQAKMPATHWHDGQITSSFRKPRSGYPESICQED